jgi:hypothetical protein
VCKKNCTVCDDAAAGADKWVFPVVIPNEVKFRKDVAEEAGSDC